MWKTVLAVVVVIILVAVLLYQFGFIGGEFKANGGFHMLYARAVFTIVPYFNGQ